MCSVVRGLMSIRAGNLSLEIISQHSRGLAPMEGVTDFPTRLWFRFIGGMDFLWTPFLRVTDTYPAEFPRMFVPEIFELKGRFATGTVVQVMGSRPEDIVRAAEKLNFAAEYLDLNCGCPSPTVVGSRAGSSLLEKVEIFSSFIETVVAGLGPERLSVKMRTGFHSERDFNALLSSIRSYPLKHLTVHGRTRNQRYTGAANWDLIEAAGAQCSFPVVGSGDICEFKAFGSRLNEKSPVYAVIVGRGALRNPWLFRGHSSAPVLTALLLFVVMQDLYLATPSTLIRWVAEEDVEQLETGEDFWMAIHHLLQRAGFHYSSKVDIIASPRALARGKMLWNYLRSSLPEAFMDPRILRANKLSDLLVGIMEISRHLGLDPDNLPICYRGEKDWIYSGQGRKPA